ncbi:MAG: hypothetical protein KF905_10310 [Flavobacteriales bacterium]|nr:hypothetical protein [Flavobacteriales bacterium]
MTGSISRYFPDKHHGFIHPDVGVQSVFFRPEDFVDQSIEFKEGDRVDYTLDPQPGFKYARARTIVLITTSKSANSHPSSNNCFVVMQHGRTPEEVRWFKGWYEVVIRPAVLEAGYEPVLSAVLDQPSAINDEIRAHLAIDPMVVIDLGGFRAENDPNPNVMYELGIRHAFNLPHVLMAWQGQRLPFDIANQRVIMEQREMVNVTTNRERLVSFIREAREGNYYRPMEAVNRIATLEEAESKLSTKSVLGALIQEVRNLGKGKDKVRFVPRVPLKKAMGSTKAERKAVMERFLKLGGTHTLWHRLTQLEVTQSELNHSDKLELLFELAQKHFPESPGAWPRIASTDHDSNASDGSNPTGTPEYPEGSRAETIQGESHEHVGQGLKTDPSTLESTPERLAEDGSELDQRQHRS